MIIIITVLKSKKNILKGHLKKNIDFIFQPSYFPLMFVLLFSLKQ